MSNFQTTPQPSASRSIGIYRWPIVVLIILLGVFGGTTFYYKQRLQDVNNTVSSLNSRVSDLQNEVDRLKVQIDNLNKVSSNQIPPIVTVSGHHDGVADRLEFSRRGTSETFHGALDDAGRYSLTLPNDATYSVRVYWSSSSSATNCDGYECWARCGDFFLYSIASQYQYDIPYNQCTP